MLRLLDVIISLFLGALVTYGGYRAGDSFFPFFPFLFCVLMAMLSSFIWGVHYDKYDKDADVFGVGFTKRRPPFFVEGEKKMNIFAFNTYMWIVLLFLNLVLWE